MPSPRCVHCDKGVYSNHRAVKCDTCQGLQHLRCGDIGITVKQYQASVRDGTGIQFTCMPCRNQTEPMEVDQDVTINYSQEERTTGADVTVNYSDVTADRSSITLRVPPANVSVTDSISADLTDNTSLFERDVDTSDFDVTRPERDLPSEVQETSLADETVTDVPMNDEVTYEIVEGGTARGAAKLVSSNGYTYVKKRTLKNGTVDWRCSVRGKPTECPASVKQIGQEIRVAVGGHTHEPRPGILTAVRVKTDIKAVSKRKVFESANVIVREVTAQHQRPQQPEASRPSHEALLKLCNRTRKGLRPGEPRGMDFEIDEEYLDVLGETFHRVTVPSKERRHVVFATDTQLDLLSRTKTWYIDGTFKVVREPFKQLLSIHGFVKSDDTMKQLPLCFVMMTGKKSRDYKKVFQAVLRLLPSIAVETFVSDFEAGIWQGLRGTFQDPEIRGCAFHFGQALWRKAQDCELQKAYTNEDSVHKLMKKVFALPLLPADDIATAFGKIREKTGADSRLNTFMDYVETNW